MTGYFSRIARQSGARVRSDEARPHTGEHLSPIDREDNVIVSRDEPLSAVTVAHHDALQPPLSSTKRSSPEAGPPSADVSFPVATSDVSQAPIREAVRPADSDTVEHSERPAALPRDETVEPPKHDTRVPPRTETPLEPEEIETNPTPTDAITIQPSEKRFFEKTTELIEARDSDPPDVRTILFREVQEWIEAGGSTSDDLLEQRSAPDEITKPDEPETATGRRPGVVTILEGRRAEKTPEQTAGIPGPEPINEQSFELSIGSISVVVEGDEKRPEPGTPIVAARPQHAEDRPRAVSRLSRHYL